MTKYLVTNASASIWRTHAGAVHQLGTTKCPVRDRCDCGTRCTDAHTECTVMSTRTLYRCVIMSWLITALISTCLCYSQIYMMNPCWVRSGRQRIASHMIRAQNLCTYIPEGWLYITRSRVRQRRWWGDDITEWICKKETRSVGEKWCIIPWPMTFSNKEENATMRTKL